MLHTTAIMFFNVITSVNLLGTINPNINLLEGKTCYQCESDSRSKPAYCDTDYFRYNTNSTFIDFTFQCPHNRADFCVKKVVHFGTYDYTYRGCSNSTDDLGNLLKSGCGSFSSGDFLSYDICFCHQNLCNIDCRVSTMFTLLACLFFILYGLN